mgnify:CR=1 FL=1
MGMDRNTVIGFVLIGILLIGMFVMNSQSNQALQVQKMKQQQAEIERMIREIKTHK